MSIDTETDALLAEVATSTPTRLRALLVAALRRQRDAGAERMRERAAAWHDGRGAVARSTVTSRRHASHAAAIRALPLTEPDDV